MFDNVELCGKLKNLLESDFRINVGSPQGDGDSTLFLIVYIAKSLTKGGHKVLNAREDILALNPTTEQEQLEDKERPTKVSENNKKHPLPHNLEDHDYSLYENTSFTVDHQYADDVG